MRAKPSQPRHSKWHSDTSSLGDGGTVPSGNTVKDGFTGITGSDVAYGLDFNGSQSFSESNWGTNAVTAGVTDASDTWIMDDTNGGAYDWDEDGSHLAAWNPEGEPPAYMPYNLTGAGTATASFDATGTDITAGTDTDSILDYSQLQSDSLSFSLNLHFPKLRACGSPAM